MKVKRPTKLELLKINEADVWKLEKKKIGNNSSCEINNLEIHWPSRKRVDSVTSVNMPHRGSETESTMMAETAAKCAIMKMPNAAPKNVDLLTIVNAAPVDPHPGELEIGTIER